MRRFWKGRCDMDEADMSQDRAEKEAPYMLAASRRPAGPTPTGRCLYCDEIVADDQRWCDTGCRDGWMREENQRGGGR